LNERPDPPPADFVGRILVALGFGAALGVGLQGLVTWTVRMLQRGGAPATAPTLTSAPAVVLLLGTLAAIVAAGLAAWVLLAAIRNPWRQAMLAIVAGLGSFVLSLVTLPIDRAFGPPGLLGLVGMSTLACLLLARRITATRKPV
jgi:hypothetical protein